MQATDMRSLSREARHERRVQVIRLRKAGNTYDKIAALTGLSRTGVFNICKRHEALGAKALHDAIGGRKLGENRLLDPAQEALVRKLIADKTPDQLKMPYALWTRAAVAQLIEQRFGLRLQVRTMGKYLARWGFTPQKPMKKAYEQSPAAVKKWLDEDYPAIAARARPREPKFTGATRVDCAATMYAAVVLRPRARRRWCGSTTSATTCRSSPP